MANANPAATATQRQSIEFVVKPTEELYLEGGLRRLPRVRKGENYPCQMQKNQAFSCLFRHYAKHNGLRKEDLVFSFVDELQPDQTPESVHLMPQDEIFVAHRKSAPMPVQTVTEKLYPQQFLTLLKTGVHSDVNFVLDEGRSVIPAHRAILSARSDYFNAMLRVGGMSESSQTDIHIDHDIASFKRMLEFIYCDNISDLPTCNAKEVVELLMTANEYIMEDLRILCEPFAAKLISMENISRLLLLTANKEPSVLRDACVQFIQDNKSALWSDDSFHKEVETNPELGLLLFHYAVNSSGSSSSFGDDGGQRKRRRCTELPENELDLVPPQLTNVNNTNTIAQSNASVQDL